LTEAILGRGKELTENELNRLITMAFNLISKTSAVKQIDTSTNEEVVMGIDDLLKSNSWRVIKWLRKHPNAIYGTPPPPPATAEHRPSAFELSAESLDALTIGRHIEIDRSWSAFWKDTGGSILLNRSTTARPDIHGDTGGEHSHQPSRVRPSNPTRRNPAHGSLEKAQKEISKRVATRVAGATAAGEKLISAGCSLAAGLI